MSKRIIMVLLGLTILFLPVSLFAITAEEIVREMDAQATFETSYSTGSIKTTDRFGTKESTFKAWSRAQPIP